MSVLIYHNGKWHSIAGNNVYQESSLSWKTPTDFDQMYNNGEWHGLGFAQHVPAASNVVIDEDFNEISLVKNFKFEKSSEPNANNIWYVSPHGAGSKDGSSWQNAIDGNVSLNAVILLADSGDVIYFLEGEYQTTYPLLIPAGVSIYGGFSVTDISWSKRDSFAHPTKFTMNADEAFTCLDANVALTVGQTIDGFFIEGYKDAFTDGSNAIMKNCTFKGLTYGTMKCHVENCMVLSSAIRVWEGADSLFVNNNGTKNTVNVQGDVISSVFVNDSLIAFSNGSIANSYLKTTSGDIRINGNVVNSQIITSSGNTICNDISGCIVNQILGELKTNDNYGISLTEIYGSCNITADDILDSIISGASKVDADYISGSTLKSCSKIEVLSSETTDFINCNGLNSNEKLENNLLVNSNGIVCHSINNSSIINSRSGQARIYTFNGKQYLNKDVIGSRNVAANIQLSTILNSNEYNAYYIVNGKLYDIKNDELIDGTGKWTSICGYYANHSSGSSKWCNCAIGIKDGQLYKIIDKTVQLLNGDTTWEMVTGYVYYSPSASSAYAYRVLAISNGRLYALTLTSLSYNISINEISNAPSGWTLINGNLKSSFSEYNRS